VAGLLDAGKGGKGKSKKDLLRRFDETMNANTLRDQLLPDSLPTSTTQAGTTTQPLPLPDPSTASPHRQLLVRALCRAHIRLADSQKGVHANAMEKWCRTRTRAARLASLHLYRKLRPNWVHGFSAWQQYGF
jgi:DnaJ family protein C protein 3